MLFLVVFLDCILYYLIQINYLQSFVLPFTVYKVTQNRYNQSAIKSYKMIQNVILHGAYFVLLY
jgi:hypothetical protein